MLLEISFETFCIVAAVAEVLLIVMLVGLLRSDAKKKKQQLLKEDLYDISSLEEVVETEPKEESLVTEEKVVLEETNPIEEKTEEVVLEETIEEVKEEPQAKEENVEEVVEVETKPEEVALEETIEEAKEEPQAKEENVEEVIEVETKPEEVVLEEVVEEPVVVEQKLVEDETSTNETPSDQNTDDSRPEPKTYSLVRYRKSLVAKLVLQPELQDNYKTIRAKILSYKKVKSRVSFKCERFYLGRKTLIKLFVRGKRIYLYYDLDPNEQPEKYHLIDVSDKKIGEELPSLQRVLSNRSLNYAMQLIEIVMRENDIEELPENKLPELDYSELLRDRSFGQLLEEKLIVEYLVKRKTPFTETTSLEEDDDDDDELLENDSTLDLEDEEVSEEPCVVEEVEEKVTAYNVDNYVSDETVEEVVVRRKENRTGKMAIVNLDSLSDEFNDGDTVNLEAMIKKHIVSKNTKRVKILARGSLDKKLHVEADDFSKQAMKLIIYSGGSVTIL